MARAVLRGSVMLLEDGRELLAEYLGAALEQHLHALGAGVTAP